MSLQHTWWPLSFYTIRYSLSYYAFSFSALLAITITTTIIISLSLLAYLFFFKKPRHNLNNSPPPLSPKTREFVEITSLLCDTSNNEEDEAQHLRDERRCISAKQDAQAEFRLLCGMVWYGVLTYGLGAVVVWGATYQYLAKNWVWVSALQDCLTSWEVLGWTGVTMVSWMLILLGLGWLVKGCPFLRETRPDFPPPWGRSLENDWEIVQRAYPTPVPYPNTTRGVLGFIRRCFARPLKWVMEELRVRGAERELLWKLNDVFKAMREEQIAETREVNGGHFFGFICESPVEDIDAVDTAIRPALSHTELDAAVSAAAPIATRTRLKERVQYTQPEPEPAPALEVKDKRLRRAKKAEKGSGETGRVTRAKAKIR